VTDRNVGAGVSSAIMSCSNTTAYADNVPDESFNDNIAPLTFNNCEEHEALGRHPLPWGRCRSCAQKQSSKCLSPRERIAPEVK
jgi:hypothetical protein